MGYPRLSLYTSCRPPNLFIYLFIMPDEVAQAIPVVGLLVDIRHAVPERRLQVVGVVAEEVHDGSPGGGREDGPRVVRDGRGDGLARQEGQAAAVGLHGEAREGQDDPCEHVYHDLLAHARDLAAARRPLPEDDVAAQQARHEAVVRPFRPAFAAARAPAEVLQQVARELVDEGEAREVVRVRARRAEDEPGFLAQGARAEEEDHDEGVREPHLGAVDGAVAASFYDGEEVVVLRVQDDALGEGLEGCEGRGGDGDWRGG